MPRPHAAAIAATGSGPASAAIGTPTSAEAAKPNDSGRRGCSRTDARPPRIAPNAPQVETIAQSRAPPSCSRAITGPSTMNAAKQKFVIAKPMIGARTHARDVTSRSPSRSSCRNVLRGRRSCAGIRSCIRNQALARKLTESIAKTQPGCGEHDQDAGDRRPEHVHHVVRDAEQRVRRLQLRGADRLRHEAVRRRPEERRGRAEERRRDDEDRQRHLMRQEHRRGERLDAGARTPSHASITARRGRRSETTPPTSVKATREIQKAASTAPSAVAEPLTESTANATASGMRASPAADEARPSHSSRKWRSDKGAKASPNLTGATIDRISQGYLQRLSEAMVVIAGDARILGFGRRDASAEVDRLYRRHADEVLRYVMLVLRSRTDAEDVVQATFIRAFRALARGERVQKPRNWLIKIAHNECRRALATRSRRAVEVELEEVPVEQAESGRAEVAARRALSARAESARGARPA